MRLAMKTIVIDNPGGKSLALKPTLRAAFDLAYEYGGFQNLWDDLARGSIVALADVIRAGTGDDSALADYIERGSLPLNVSIYLLVKHAIEFVRVLIGEQDQAEIESATPANDITFTEFHERLFAIATGWMGWAPKDAWDATPAEILVAYRAHTERLKAIYGGKEAEADNSIDLTKGRLDPETRNRLNHIGDLTKITLP